MHRLFTIAAIVASAFLISVSSDAASPGPGGGPHVRVFNGQSAAADEGHKDWINLNKVVAIRWAPGIVSRNVKVQGRILLGTDGEPQHGTLKILKHIDKATPLLARAVRTGQPLPKVGLIVPAVQGTRAHQGATLTITNSTISGHHTSGASKGKDKKVPPMESMSLNF